MQIEFVDISSIIPYPHNNRVHSAAQIALIAQSLTEFGWTQPLVIDESSNLLVGHGRLLAAQSLAMSTVPVYRIQGLSNAQKRAYRILDNKLQNDSEWDLNSLQIELEALRQSDFSIEKWDLDNLRSLLPHDDEVDEKYTRKIKAPIYQPTGAAPKVSELYDLTTANKLIEAIQQADDLPADCRAFLIAAASRHIQFDYSKIAEFYANASPHVQRLFESSALVIIDFDKAIANGFVLLTDQLAAIYQDEYGDEN